MSACAGITHVGHRRRPAPGCPTAAAAAERARRCCGTLQYQQKPAYTAVHNALGGTDPSTTTTTTRPPTTTSRPTDHHVPAANHHVPAADHDHAEPPTGTRRLLGQRTRLVNQWPSGFQGEVTVTNTGSTATTGWSVGLNFANGQTHHPDLERPDQPDGQPLHRHQHELQRRHQPQRVANLRLPRQLERHQRQPNSHL